MRIKIKNLARIKEASVALKPLTIFIGKNNTNKSYVAHVFYALLDLASVRWRHVEKNISEIIEKEYIKETVEQLKPFLEKTEETMLDNYNRNTLRHFNAKGIKK